MLEQIIKATKKHYRDQNYMQYDYLNNIGFGYLAFDKAFVKFVTLHDKQGDFVSGAETIRYIIVCRLKDL